MRVVLGIGAVGGVAVVTAIALVGRGLPQASAGGSGLVGHVAVTSSIKDGDSLSGQVRWSAETSGVDPTTEDDPRASEPWRGDFETGDFRQWDLGIQEKEADRASIVQAPVRHGRFAARFEVRPGDSDSGGERTETLIGNGPTGAAEGVEQFWSWSTMFDASFRSNASAWNTFTQWHNSGISGGTTGFQVRGTRIWFESFGGDPGSPIRKSWRVVANRVNAKWYDFVFHVKWSSNPRVGFIEVWVNRKLMAPKTFTATLYGGQTVYLKQGYYRNPQPNVAVIYHDGMKRGSTLAEVADWAKTVPTPRSRLRTR